MEMLVIEIKPDDLFSNQNRRCWLIDIDQGKNFCYRSRISFNSFFYGKKMLNKKFKNIYVATCIDDVTFKYYRNPKKIKSIWDFYLEIGFDYKSKKFIKGVD